MRALLNGTHALITPHRCGTRYLSSILDANDLIDEAILQHDFRRDLFDYYIANGLKVTMMIRNPFIRERSVHRWLCQIRREEGSFSFKQFIERDLYEVNSYFTVLMDAPEVIENTNFVDLSMIGDFLVNELGIPAHRLGEGADKLYNFPVDDLDDFQVYRDNPQFAEAVAEKYRRELNYFDFWVMP